MKYIIIIAISLIEIDTFAQQIRNFNDIPQDILVNLNKMGRDTEIALNNYEAEFLNKIFENSRENFDFINKNNFLICKVKVFSAVLENFIKILCFIII